MSCLPFLWMLSSQHTNAPTDSLSGRQNLAFKTSTPQHLHKPSNHNRSEQSLKPPIRRERGTQQHGVQPQQSTEAHLRLGAARPIKRGLHTGGGVTPHSAHRGSIWDANLAVHVSPARAVELRGGWRAWALRGIVSTYLGRYVGS